MSVPIGTIMAYAGDIAGAAKGALERQGWLPCDGDAVNRHDFPELFDVIGDAYGAGDHIVTFNLPDLRGRFLRGVDHGLGRDPDANTRVASMEGGNIGDCVGTLQADEFKSHIHSINKWSRSFVGSNDPDKPYDDRGPIQDKVGATGGNETRPKNVSVNWIIKVKNVPRDPH